MKCLKRILLIGLAVLMLSGCAATEKPAAAATETTAPVVETTAPAAKTTAPAAAEELCDEVVYGTIYTSNESSMHAEAMAIKDGKIVYIGDRAGAEGYIGANTVVTDYSGSFIMPGFVDGHVHIYIDAENQAGFRFGESLEQTQEAYLNILKEYVEANPDLEIYKGFGWLDSAFIGGTPTAAMLDEICADKPIFIESEDCHSCWINTKMLEMTGVTADTPDPIGGKVEHDQNGNPNGCFRDTAMDTLVKPFVPIYSVDEYKEMLLDAQDKMLSLGYTAMVDVIIDPQSADNICQAYYELDQEGKLKIKVNEALVVNNTENYVSDLEHVKALSEKYHGTHFQITDVKIFMDGIVESETAYVSKPYVGTEQYGADRWPGEEGTQRLYDLTKRINDLGLVAHFHAIGDAAITKALDAIEYVRENSENKDIRNVITHLQMCSQEDIQRMVKLNVIASADLGWAPSVSEDLGVENIELLNVGEERNNAMYPYGSMLDAGVTVAYATDYPAGPIIFPLVNLHAGITREHLGFESMMRNAEEALTIDQALKAMTITGAYQLGREAETGSLEVGKYADFIVFKQDLTAIDPFDIYLAEYLAVYAEGENVLG